MKILIALAVTNFDEGDRVAVEFAKDEWYVGTIRYAENRGHWRIKFDDGKSHTIHPNKDRIVRVEIRSRKTALTRDEVRDVQIGGRRSATPTRSRQRATRSGPSIRQRSPRTPRTRTRSRTVAAASRNPRSRTTQRPARSRNPASPPRPRSRTTQRPAPPRPPVNIRESNLQTAEEKHLMQALTDKTGWLTAVRMGSHSQTQYLLRCWQRINKHFFGGKLKPPRVRLQKDMGKRFNRRGAWFSTHRIISIAPRLFMGLEVHVLTTMVHEVCHQAVNEIDGNFDRTRQGHGYHWETWMRKCGLTPSRYSKYDNENFMSEGEKNEQQIINVRKEKSLREVQDKGMKKIWPRDLTPAQWHDAKRNEWIPGLIVCHNDQQGKRWIFITSPYSDSWKIIPNNWFYDVTPSVRDKFLSNDFKEAAERIKGHKEMKSIRRGQKRDLRYRFRTLLNM